MELMLIITIVLGGLVLLDALAVAFGADSRDSIGDDWARSVRV
jgi:hypothetical protein